MKALRKVFRPRWVLAGLAVAAAVVPVALMASGGASAGKATLPPTSPLHPIVDARWIYGQDFYEANQFIYKVAGSDGCLPGAANCSTGGALPATSTTCPRTTTGRRSSTPGGRASGRATPRSPTGRWAGS